jgi:glycosyltransferase involved in cell wall biosynthesis
MEDPLIIHILPAFVPYGAERVALELVARLPSRGFRTQLVSLFGGEGLREELRQRHIKFTSLAETHAVSRLHVASQLSKLIREQGDRAPAIVHTHLFGSDFWTAIARTSAFAPFLQARPSNAVFISTSHNVDRDDSSPRRFARRWCMMQMDAVAAISEEVSRYTHEDLGVHTERIQVIPNGVDLASVGVRGPRPFRDAPSLLIVGRLVPQKGHEVALRALAAVPPPWTLRLVGGGPLERSLKELVEKLGIASRVEFLGERHDVPAIMRDADLLLFPSQWEGMGVALVEAVAAGVPVLASNLPALRELLPEDRLVDHADVPSWTAAIKGVIADSKSALARAERLAPDVRKRYDVETMVDRYASLYRDQLHAKSA